MKSQRGSFFRAFAGKILIMSVAFLFLIACGIAISQTIQPQEKNIESLLREKINKSQGELTDSDFIGLTELDASRQGLTDLDGIQNCKNLRILNLRENYINTDVILLQYMTNLEELDLADNRIEEFRTLAALSPSLKKLNLEGNRIKNGRPLGKLVNLEELNLNRNLITDFGFVESLQKLRWLSLERVNLRDLGFLTGFPELEYLSIYSNKIESLEPLLSKASFKAGCKIDLRNNPLNEKSRLFDISLLRDKYKIIPDKQIGEIENMCRLTLRALGSTELAYQDQNLNNDYGSWDALTANDYIMWGYTRSNIIDYYSLAVVKVKPSSATAEKTRKMGHMVSDSTFTMVTVPTAKHLKLRTFAIDEHQTPYTWIGPNSEWDLTSINLTDRSLWEPNR